MLEFADLLLVFSHAPEHFQISFFQRRCDSARTDQSAANLFELRKTLLMLNRKNVRSFRQVLLGAIEDLAANENRHQYESDGNQGGNASQESDQKFVSKASDLHSKSTARCWPAPTVTSFSSSLPRGA